MAKKQRSQPYPYLSLEEAIDKAQIAFDHDHDSLFSVPTVFSHWGQKSNTGPGITILSALKQFGLFEDMGSGENRKLKLSDLALRIIRDKRPQSPERQDAIREAALKPTLFKTLWERYAGNLPSEAELKHIMKMEYGIIDTSVDRAYKTFVKTIDFSRMAEHNKTQDERAPKPGSEPSTQDGGRRIMVADAIVTADSGKIAVLLGINQKATLEFPMPLTKDKWTRIKEKLDDQLKEIISESEGGKAKP